MYTDEVAIRRKECINISEADKKSIQGLMRELKYYIQLEMLQFEIWQLIIR